MSETAGFFLTAFTVIAVVALIVGGTLKSCSMDTEAYTTLANSCIREGGSWVPTSGNSYYGTCVGARR